MSYIVLLLRQIVIRICRGNIIWKNEFRDKI